MKKYVSILGRLCIATAFAAISMSWMTHSVDAMSGSSALAVNQTSQLSLSTGRQHTCALSAAQTLYCWGRNLNGQLGDNTLLSKNVPTLLAATSGINVSLGREHSCVVTASGAVKCWGWNTFGQLGDNTTTDQNVPMQVSGIGGTVTQVVGGTGHTCVLLATKSMECWGFNGSGQLGLNNGNNDALTPSAVPNVANVTAIASGLEHMCVLITGGVKCWGNNSNGNIGVGTSQTAPIAVPTTPTGLSSGVTAIVSGEDHNCAIMNDTSLKCWGYNSDGQVGSGTLGTDVLTPTDVLGLTGVTAVALGSGHSCALLVDTSVKCWGNNLVGQRGIGTVSGGVTTPTAVSGLTGVAAISAGTDHTCAMLNTGTVKCWGANTYGELGDGSNTDRSTPVIALSFAGPTVTSSTTSTTSTTAPSVTSSTSTTAAPSTSVVSGSPKGANTATAGLGLPVTGGNVGIVPLVGFIMVIIGGVLRRRPIR